METKVMTKEEVFEFFKNTKVLCTSVEETTNVQKKLFELGFEYYGENSREEIECAFAIFINNFCKMRFTTDLAFWISDCSRRIEPGEIIAIQLKEETPKFDPKTLQLFDKVLVRDEHFEKWSADFFNGIDIDNVTFPYRGIKNVYKQLIPYNEETKHLHGTAEEAPEFYNI